MRWILTRLDRLADAAAGFLGRLVALAVGWWLVGAPDPATILDAAGVGLRAAVAAYRAEAM